MTIRTILISLYYLATLASPGAAAQDKAALSPPAWIQGTWSRLAESNSQNIDTYRFGEHEITVREGFGNKEISLAREYGQSGFSEESGPDFYRIVLKSAKGEVLYEFRRCATEWCGRSPTPELTVEAFLFGVQHRFPSTSINALLIRDGSK